jgi:four helix bundle protein
MGKIQKFEDLEVWKNAMQIAVDVYKISSTGKLCKDYGLKDQITRAAISISNNIAEGFEYDNNKDFVKFLRYAKGSCGEVRNIVNFLVLVDFIESPIHKELSEKLISLSKTTLWIHKLSEKL